MSREGSEGRLGAKNLEAKYQKTAILMIPVMVWPIPPACCCCCRGCWPPAAVAGAGGAMELYP